MIAFIRIIFFVGIASFLCLFNNVDVFAQLSVQNKVGASMLQSLIVELESEFEVEFVGTELATYVVGTKENDTENKPALIRITGGAAEFVIDLEIQRLDGSSESDSSVVSVYDFNVGQEDAGAYVAMIPEGEKHSFVLAIGGTVEGGIDEKHYTGINILNINYL